MLPELIGQDGELAGARFPIGGTGLTLGRHKDNAVVIAGRDASRYHAEVVRRGGSYVLHDQNSSNGTQVNGVRVTSQALRNGDLITIGSVTLRFEEPEVTETLTSRRQPRPDPPATATADPGPVLNATVSGGGPVGLAFALLLEHLLGQRAAITIYDGRWVQDGARVVWKDERQGNVRRQQVVTIQSRQFLSLSEEIQARLFGDGSYSEMWPVGPDSIGGYGPRNIRIADVEDRLLELANEKSDRIRLIPTRFDPTTHREQVAQDHVLAICEGGRSRTREHFADSFGRPDRSIYSLDGEHVRDTVLGLRVRSALSDPMTVLLTVAQNRFLLNSLCGEGFLNMRLTDDEAREVIGIDPVRQVFEECVAARPCMMARDDHGNYQCPTHRTLFLPALVKGSALWRRVMEGLALFGIAEKDLSAVTAFRLDMVQRPRFTARLYAPSSGNPGTYGFLLGDAANAIHFWPGRGLNSGLASAISLSRALRNAWRGRPFRDADFLRHEAAMSMLQYRHKSRAWQSMVTTDDDGVTRTIKEKIAQGIEAAAAGRADRAADIDVLMHRLRTIRNRLASRLPSLPSDAVLCGHLRRLSDETLRTLRESGAWNTAVTGGEEPDVHILYRSDSPEAPALQPV